MTDNPHQEKNILPSQEAISEDTISSQTEKTDSRKDFRIKPKMFLVYLAVIALAWGIRQAGGLDLDEFFSLVDEYPVSAPIIFVFAYALLVALLIPTLPVNLAAGVLWGGLWGGVLATAGGALGAIIAFLFARTSLGQPLVRRYNNRILRWMTDQLENNTWKVIAFVRLNPAFPSGPVNFLFGLTSVPLRLYAYSSTIFLLPPAIGVALIGAQAGEIVLSGESIKMFEVLTLSLFGILILLISYWSGKALLNANNKKV
jgi:uncharacterized membrane protein YdjX (TVP38/TMEM64 family)